MLKPYRDVFVDYHMLVLRCLLHLSFSLINSIRKYSVNSMMFEWDNCTGQMTIKGSCIQLYPLIEGVNI